MAIRIEHGSVMPALSLARIAGRGQATQQRRAADLALLDFGLRMEAQRDRREAQERAFSLQTAAAERRARTPMARAEVRSPFADPVQLRVEDERAYQTARREEQMVALNQMKETGQISALDYSRNRLRILGGQAPKYGAEELSVSERMFGPRTRRKVLLEERRGEVGWAMAPSGTAEENARRESAKTRITAIDAELKALGGIVSGQTIDPKTGEAAPAAATGPQATTKRLTGKPSPARKRQAIAAAKLMLMRAKPEERTREKIAELAETLLLNPMLLSSLRAPK